MATARKLPSGKFRVRVYDKRTGKTKSFTAPTKREAEFLANEWLTGRQIKPIEEKTVKEACVDYIELKSAILSPTTLDKYKVIPEKQLSEEFVNRKLGDLDGVTIQAEVNRLSAVYAPKTVHNAHGFLSAVLRTYYPALIYRVTLPKIQKRLRELPSAEEIIPIFLGDEIELYVLLAMWLGFRESEILGLKRSDFEGDTLVISRVVVRVKGGKIIVKDIAKTVESRRPMKIPARIKELALAAECTESGFLTELTGNAIYKRFINRMEKAGYKGITFHDLRHINASTMHLLGIPDKYAMERGGWSNTATLQKVYQETFSSERQAVDEKIDNYFENILATKLATNTEEHGNKAELSA